MLQILRGFRSRILPSRFSDDFKKHFLGTHFFNPPRYMKLVEVIPTEWTSGEVACKVHGFMDKRLGKGVVSAKDEPNFIANRVGDFRDDGDDSRDAGDGFLRRRKLTR